MRLGRESDGESDRIMASDVAGDGLPWKDHVVSYLCSNSGHDGPPTGDGRAEMRRILVTRLAVC